MAFAIAGLGLAGGGGIEYDGAVYLERGLYHAEQVQAKGNLYALRLPWSLQFEAPKPPAYHGMIAALALAVGRARIGPILFLALFLPLAALCLGTAALAREAGSSGGLLAPMILAAMPAIVTCGTRVLVEVALAACVTVSAYFAIRLMDAAGGTRDVLGLGFASGLAALTKLTGIVFSGVILATVVVWTWRREAGERRAGRAALALLLAVALAAPWYLRNGLAAVDFGRFSADSWAHWDAGTPLTRPGRLLLATLGWPVAAVLALSLLPASRSARRGRGSGSLGALAGAVGAISAVMVIAARNFDSRFWVPSLGLIAAWLAAQVAFWASTTRRRRAIAACLALALALSVGRAVGGSRSVAPWRLSVLLAQRAADLPAGSRICNLGESYDWNRYQMRLMVEVSEVRPRPRVVDLQHEVAPADLAEAVAGCDLLFALEPSELSQERTQVRLNARLEQIRPIVAQLAEEALERDAPAERFLLPETPLQVWRSR